MGWNIASRKRPGLRRFAALLGVLALAIQCFVAQTHVHGDASIGASGVQIVALDHHHATLADATQHQHTPKTPPHGHSGVSDCLLCQSAIAGVGVLPTTPAFALVDIDPGSHGAFALAVDALDVHRSHIWQSRAPPTFA